MVLGLLLARAGVGVVVLEKHGDFLRDFRGDTLHPSTLEVMHELGYLPDLLRLPHQEVRTLRWQVGEDVVSIADFGHLPTRCKFLAFMPQWDFLKGRKPGRGRGAEAKRRMGGKNASGHRSLGASEKERRGDAIGFAVVQADSGAGSRGGSAWRGKVRVKLVPAVPVTATWASRRRARRRTVRSPTDLAVSTSMSAGRPMP